jgi:hypothetical protein
MRDERHEAVTLDKQEKTLPIELLRR